jgi:transcriptional regulator
LLEETFKAFEAKFKNQWDTLPEDYKNELLSGIVAFEIKVSNLEGKFKLSQNRTEGDRERIIKNFEGKDDKVKSDIAKYMKKNKER